MPGTSTPVACEIGDNSADDDAPLERFLAGLPGPTRRAFAWARCPEARWARIPAAILLLFGGLLGVLPLLGFWMAPLGILLLSADVPVLRRPTMRALGAVQRWWDLRRARMGGRP